MAIHYNLAKVYANENINQEYIKTILSDFITKIPEELVKIEFVKNPADYDLVVIDESHNFRNNNPGRRDEEGNIEKYSRYGRLMDHVIKKGIRSKVLLLSATPVNNSLKDLRNQIYLLTENKDRIFEESMGIPSLQELLTGAQRSFSKRE
jgi:SNF2 family DNA or RNA helicase